MHFHYRYDKHRHFASLFFHVFFSPIYICVVRDRASNRILTFKKKKKKLRQFNFAPLQVMLQKIVKIQLLWKFNSFMHTFSCFNEIFIVLNINFKIYMLLFGKFIISFIYCLVKHKTQNEQNRTLSKQYRLALSNRQRLARNS